MINKFDIIIEQATSEEYLAIGEITYLAYQSIAGIPSERYHPFNLDLINTGERANISGNIIFAAKNKHTDEILASVTLTLETYNTEPLITLENEAGIRMLSVSPQASGSGIGRLLVEKCISKAKSLGKEKILLHTIEPMVAARSLYESFGFKRYPAMDVQRSSMDVLCYKLQLSK
ncbi:MAG: GNAT family N-acetyltransferase [Paraglaciecola sp.]|nr:GNAT family N-acetyltransferase [Paraglaciecola sp.]